MNFKVGDKFVQVFYPGQSRYEARRIWEVVALDPAERWWIDAEPTHYIVDGVLYPFTPELKRHLNLKLEWFETNDFSTHGCISSWHCEPYEP